MPREQPTDIGSAWRCGQTLSWTVARSRVLQHLVSPDAMVSGMQTTMIRDARFTGEPEVSFTRPSLTQTAG